MFLYYFKWSMAFKVWFFDEILYSDVWFWWNIFNLYDLDFSAELESPLKWQADDTNYWYFEKQNATSLIWTERCNRTFFCRIYTQIDNFADSDGKPIVTLKPLDNEYKILLSEGVACNITNNCSVYTTGIWKLKQRKYIQ